MKRIIIDTNFLMIPSQFKIDIFAEMDRVMSEPYQLCVFRASVEELEKLKEKKDKDRQHVLVALKLIKQKNLKTLPNSVNEKYADKSILEGVTNKDIVCTQDKELKRALKTKHKGIRFITLKSKKYLSIE